MTEDFTSAAIGKNPNLSPNMSLRCVFQMFRFSFKLIASPGNLGSGSKTAKTVITGGFAV